MRSGGKGWGGVGRRGMLTEHFTACAGLLDASQVELLLGEGLDVLWEQRREEGTGGMREGRGLIHVNRLHLMESGAGV